MTSSSPSQDKMRQLIKPAEAPNPKPPFIDQKISVAERKALYGSPDKKQHPPQPRKKSDNELNNGQFDV